MNEITIRPLFYVGAWRALVEYNGTVVAISSGASSCEATFGLGMALAAQYLNSWSNEVVAQLMEQIND